MTQGPSTPPSPESPLAGDGPDLPVLPDQTRDDTDEGWGGRREREDWPGDEDDERFLRDRPPHWG